MNQNRRKSSRSRKKFISFLIVDDNIFNIKSLEGIIKISVGKEFCFNIDSCLDGEEALEKIIEKENLN